MTRGICLVFLALALSACRAPELKEVGRRVIRESDRSMNFCFANNFPDGTIYMWHSMGTHMKDERHVNIFSPDNGKTWRFEGPMGGMNAFLTKDGEKRRVSCWRTVETNEHDIIVETLGKDGKIRRDKSRIRLPRAQEFRLHRNVARLSDGRLLLTGYALSHKTRRCSAFAVDSADEGLHWRFLSDIPDVEKAQEGPNEGTVVQLASGDILAFVRMGNAYGKKNSYVGLVRFRSRDGGRTWINEGEVAEYGVDPQAMLLSDGTLALLSGRPGVYLMLDPTGTGDHFVRHDVYKGMGSSYASLMETSPGNLVLIYDESGFFKFAGDTPTNRIVQVNYVYR